LALKSALSTKVKESSITVLENLVIEAPKTKEIINLLKALDVNSKALIVTTERDDVVTKSANNLQNVKVLYANQINTLDILAHDRLIITKDAVESIGEVLA